MNKLIKANERVLRLWARVLDRVPDSRLLVLGPTSPEDLAFVRERFAKCGIPAERLDVVGRMPRRQYLECFNRIDIALDTFPYNGHTTTLDGLWMGVPCVGLAGDAHVSRETLAVNKLMGLEDLTARDEDEYVEIAAALANDRPRLAELRRTLRSRMLASPLCDGKRLAREMEKAFRGMWETWCAGRTSCARTSPPDD